jgi:hypothetical protein
MKILGSPTYSRTEVAMGRMISWEEAANESLQQFGFRLARGGSDRAWQAWVTALGRTAQVWVTAD